MMFFLTTSSGKAVWVNLAHVVKVESEPSGDTLTLHLTDGSKQNVTGEETKQLRTLLHNLSQYRK